MVKIVAMGRLCEQKNFELLIRSFSIVSDENAGLILDIFGEGPSREALGQLIEELGKREQIKLCGWTTDVAKTMREADLFVMSSDFEGMPNALQEAMTCGVPCISTDCPTGPSDLIRNNETGILVPVKDAYALSKAIKWAIENPKQIAEMGKKGYQDVTKRYLSESICRRLIEEMVK